MSTENGTRLADALFRVSLPVAGVLLMARAAAAFETDWSAQARAVASDNVHRAVAGSESTGVLYNLDTTLLFKGSRGRASWSLLGSGGWETLDDGEGDARADETYLVRASAQAPMGAAGTLEGSLEGSQATEVPESTDLFQGRIRTNRDQARILARVKPGTRAEGQLEVASTGMRRPDRETDETQVALRASLPVGRLKTLTVEAAGVDGSEARLDDTWVERSAAVSLAWQSERLVNTSLRADWQGSELETGGVRGESKRFGLGFNYRFSLAEGWVFSQGMGMDGLEADDGAAEWEVKADVSLAGALGSATNVRLGLFSRPTLEDASEGNVRISRTTEGQAALDWRATRALTVSPSFLYRLSDPFDAGAFDLTENTAVWRIRASWAFPRTWSVALTGTSETRESSADSADLSESSLELNISCVFF